MLTIIYNETILLFRLFYSLNGCVNIDFLFALLTTTVIVACKQCIFNNSRASYKLATLTVN